MHQSRKRHLGENWGQGAGKEGIVQEEQGSATALGVQQQSLLLQLNENTSPSRIARPSIRRKGNHGNINCKDKPGGNKSLLDGTYMQNI